MLKACPNSIDVIDLQFKLQCRLKIFNNIELSTFQNTPSLISCASRYGLLFVGTNEKYFQVIQTNNLHNYFSKDKEVSDYPRRNVNLPSLLKHICCNCDSTILAIVVEQDQCPLVIFYDILSFFTTNIKIIKEIRLSATPNVHVNEIGWNPSIPGIFTACKSDGTLGIYELKGDTVDINSLPTESGSTCFCWSPKGKQIAVGDRSGKITQYKPDLKAVRIIPAPTLKVPQALISLQWVSNYQFIGVYQELPEGSGNVIVIDAPKGAEISYTDYDDICYSGVTRPPQFYLIYQPNWNVIMVASANGSEVGVLSNSGDTWIQWIMPDSARAEIPLNVDYQETFPIGLTLDISSTTPLPWGEATIPPCPLLCILSHEGVLSCYNVVFLKEGIPSICTPPDAVPDQTGLSLFTTANPTSLSQSTPVKLTTTQTETNATKNLNAPVSKPFSFDAPIQSTPLVPNKILPNSAGPFGDQVQITPIKATSLFGGQTLVTPATKPSTDSVATVEKPATTTEKYASIFAALNTPSTAQPTPAASVKPILVTTKPEAKPVQDVTPQQSMKATTKSEIDLVTPELKAETAAILSQMIKDEWYILETELRFLLKQCQSVKISLGSDQEKIDMVDQIENLQSFLKEAVDISVGQSSEIHCLKQSVIQSWAWFEEAKSHYNVSKNVTVALLMRLQPLDSVADKKLKDIQQLIYYIESQLSQVNKALDEQWANFQNHTKNSYKVKLPTMEAIFQTMVRQSAILQRQTYVLKDISMRLRKKTSVSSSLLLSLEKSTDLVDDLKNLHLSTHDVLELQREKIKHYTNSLTMTKIRNLRNLLKNKPVTKVIAIKPQLSSWVMGQSSASKIRQSIASLGNYTPVSRASVARNLNFTQPDLSKDVLVTYSKEEKNTTDISTQPLTSSTSQISSSSGFISLSKTPSAIINTQSSAFAPTGSAPSTVITEPKGPRRSSSNFSSAPTSNAFNFGSENFSTISLIKPTISSLTPKSQAAVEKTPVETTSLGFSFSQKNTLTTAATIQSSIFSTTSSGAFSYTTPTSQVGKLSSPSIAAPVTPLNLVKPIQPPSTVASGTSLFGSQPSLFAAGNINKLSAISSTPSNGAISLFGNGQVTITKAVPSTSASNMTGSIFTTTVNTTNGSKNAESLPIFGTAAPKPPTTDVTKDSATIFSHSTSNVKPELTAQSSIFTSSTNISSLPTANVTIHPVSTVTAGSTSKPLFFGSPPTTSLTTLSFDGSTSTSASIFGGTKTTVPSTAFGTAPTASSTPFGSATASTGTLFGAAATTSSTLFGGTATGSLFGSPEAFSSLKLSTTSSAPPLFQKLPTTAASSSGATLFVNKAATVTVAPSTPSLFGNVQTSSTPATQSIFGNTQATSAATLFGKPATTAAASVPPSNVKSPTFSTVSETKTNTTITSTTTGTSSSLFGSNFSSVSSPSTSLWGKTDSTDLTTKTSVSPPSSSSIFGSSPSSASTTTASSSIFGQSVSSTFPTSTTAPVNIFTGAATNSIFGKASIAPTNIFGASTGNSTTTTASPTAAGIFGKSTTAVSTSTSSFGSPNSTTSFGVQNNSIFGGNKPSVFGQASFGNQTGFNTQQPQATTSSSVFGQAATFGSGSVFGQTTTTTSSVFGNVSAASSSFGTGFGSTSTSTAPSGSFGFGGLNVSDGSSGSGNGFGGTGNVFGAAPGANPFGKAEPKSTFGPGTTNMFSSPASTSSSAFGSSITSSSSVFGSNAPSAFGSSGGGFGGTSNTFSSSPFGQKPSFGQPTTFGSSSPFGNPQSQGSFSGGSSSTVAQTGFASPAAFQKPGGFGSAPVFGGAQANAFGAAPSFGGTPTFGSAPAFGTPEKVFGAAQPSAPFGAASTQQQNAGFGNIASQNTIGFGNLAQQANTPNSMSFSGGSSFSTWR
ncbi:hypothetical protein GWI33_008840 [Rhynchophorus ferrugineus]|uniref:Nucleoporin Nup159/Nup146 N-terminal domain-containing protein n=1 Tax=Rhynchophorus ferrugineus TaxID=354439 RepID=A0A834IE67_RHYFE|nr:hypothetical protein GWI33_008840 [Rhynchophorus ferrugineus]